MSGGAKPGYSPVFAYMRTVGVVRHRKRLAAYFLSVRPVLSFLQRSLHGRALIANITLYSRSTP